ncbi:type II toxin-antitoxin system VapB family antitoxin [Streptomyces sp. MJM1172]|uniref:type II toxin-antitoxin system VapB family antitoxin n=1 Tax=Streptomyces sp. MJM1172 TaxID=1703926 RepID=UPI0009A24CAE|nr:type II toxin-antitoxin system VapB family antitoxin [Streptomyces sp. MJM1172]
MARTVIDVDEDMLEQAAEVFGTKTKVATVNAALADAVNRRKRQAFFDWLAEGGLPDLTGPVPPAAEQPAEGADPKSATGEKATGRDATGKTPGDERVRDKAA